MKIKFTSLQVLLVISFLLNACGGNLPSGMKEIDCDDRSGNGGTTTASEWRNAVYNNVEGLEIHRECLYKPDRLARLVFYNRTKKIKEVKIVFGSGLERSNSSVFYLEKGEVRPFVLSQVSSTPLESYLIAVDNVKKVPDDYVGIPNTYSQKIDCYGAYDETLGHISAHNNEKVNVNGVQFEIECKNDGSDEYIESISLFNTNNWSKQVSFTYSLFGEQDKEFNRIIEPNGTFQIPFGRLSKDGVDIPVINVSVGDKSISQGVKNP